MARQRYQDGSLFLRGSRIRVWVGRWRDDVILPSGEIKRPHRSVVLGSLRDYPTQKLARRALNARLAEVNSANYRAKPLATLSQFTEKWQATVLPNHKPSTQLGVRSVLKNHILPGLGNIQVKDLDAETVQRFVSGLKLSAKSARNVYITLRMLWKSARAWGYVTHDPFDGIVLPRRGPQHTFSFSVEDVRRILGTAGEPYRTFYWLAAETGMRAGELSGLTLDNVDLSAGTVAVTQAAWRGKIQSPKSAHSIRTIALSAELASHLRRFLLTWKPNPSRLLFASRNGTPWDCNLLVKRKLHPLLDSLGIERCGLHAFRHGVASMMDHLDVPIKTRQLRLGHADAMTTLGTYTHAVDSDDRKIAEQLGRILSVDSLAVVANA